MTKLYDTFTKADIEINLNDAKQREYSMEQLNDLLSGKVRHLNDRYILPQNKDKIFTLINIEDNQEYEGITGRGIALQMGIDYDSKTSSSVKNLRLGKVYRSKVNNSVFILKNGTKIIKANQNIECFKLYDIFQNKEITINYGQVMKVSEELGFDYTSLSKLGISSKCILDRYILAENKDQIFTLVDFETGKEYNCINNYSLFPQIGAEYTDNDGKYIYELKSGRQIFASIAGRVFHLKGADLENCKRKPLKFSCLKYEELLKKDKIRYKIASRIRGRVHKALKQRLNGGKITKSARTFELLGCNIDFYIGFLEAKFKPGMTWDNYGNAEGTWQIDHIVPCASFDLSTPENQRACFHYSNTQPMWTSENLRKNDKSNWPS